MFRDALLLQTCVRCVMLDRIVTRCSAALDSCPPSSPQESSSTHHGGHAASPPSILHPDDARLPPPPRLQCGERPRTPHGSTSEAGAVGRARHAGPHGCHCHLPLERACLHAQSAPPPENNCAGLADKKKCKITKMVKKCKKKPPKSMKKCQKKCKQDAKAKRLCEQTCCELGF